MFEQIFKHFALNKLREQPGLEVQVFFSIKEEPDAWLNLGKRMERNIRMHKRKDYPITLYLYQHEGKNVLALGYPLEVEV